MSTLMICIIVFGLMGAALYYYYTKQKGLLDEGKMVKRTAGFYEYAEQFTLKPVDFDQVVKAVQNADYSGTKVSLSLDNEKKYVIFTEATFNALLHEVSRTDENTVYEFSMAHWKERNGTPYGLMDMNVLMTSIEKAFVGLDPAAKVTSRPLNLKTKTDLF